MPGPNETGYVREPEDGRGTFSVPGELHRELQHDREKRETGAADDGENDVQRGVVVGLDCGIARTHASAPARDKATKKEMRRTLPDERQPARGHNGQRDLGGEREVVREHAVEERRRDRRDDETDEQQHRAHDARRVRGVSVRFQLLPSKDTKCVDAMSSASVSHISTQRTRHHAHPDEDAEYNHDEREVKPLAHRHVRVPVARDLAHHRVRQLLDRGMFVRRGERWIPRP